jgi:hypothetical protein
MVPVYRAVKTIFFTRQGPKLFNVVFYAIFLPFSAISVRLYIKRSSETLARHCDKVSEHGRKNVVPCNKRQLIKHQHWLNKKKEREATR